ncbi:hypothetical protein STCU_11477 [Strigomonas culicis]|uniref:Uncharacterized protein n=1 Tax=Strigomonas culicis TaxID=28005 RepID=S9TH20_9TRYP|nr:hypothetical protein STCU_11477 [Strigomonas culicis]|eukprot:EPY16204.1 hypothetical protein STCU_11477 [Strigomonas culicis]
MTLYPDETAYYRTLDRSDKDLAEEAMESPFDFTDSAEPLTSQVAALFGEELTLEVMWTPKQMFASAKTEMPDMYEVTVRCGGDVYRDVCKDSIVSAFVGAMLKAESEKDCSNFMEAMWLEYVQLKSTETYSGQEIVYYLFDHFFGVPEGRGHAISVEPVACYTPFSARVDLNCSSFVGDAITLAWGFGSTQEKANHVALQRAAALNFREVFTSIRRARSDHFTEDILKYAKGVQKMCRNMNISK